MTPITIPKILPVPSNLPLASFNIGRFTSVKDWWMLNREAFNGQALRPGNGSFGLTASGALSTEGAYGFNYPRGTGDAATPFLSGKFLPPSRLFTLASIQRMDTGATEPWGIGFGGSVASGLRLRPVARGTSGLFGWGLFGAGGLSNIGSFSPNLPGAPLGTPFVLYYVFDLTNAGAAAPTIGLRASVDGMTFGTATISAPAPQTVAAEMELNILRANASEPFAGPVMDILTIDGDITAQLDLMVEINAYAAKSYGAGG